MLPLVSLIKPHVCVTSSSKQALSVQERKQRLLLTPLLMKKPARETPKQPNGNAGMMLLFGANMCVCMVGINDAQTLPSYKLYFKFLCTTG